MCEYYEINAKRYAEETFSVDMSEQYKKFLPLLREQARILDLGSGSGRDACYFQKKGYQVTALEPSKNLCREIRKVFSGKIVCSDIQSYQPEQRFDGIWACASLLHVNKKDILDVIKNVSSNLNDNGIFYMSFKYGEDEYIDEKGRYFNCYTEETFNELINKVEGLKIMKVYKTIDIVPGRGDITWLNAICVKES